MKTFTQIFRPIHFSLFFLSAFSLSASDDSQVRGFKENKGQVHDQNFKPMPEVLFMSNDGQLNYIFKKNQVSYQLSKVDSWIDYKTPDLRFASMPSIKVPDKITLYRVDLQWLGANKNPEILKGQMLGGVDNYYLETCANGALNVRTYGNLTYLNLYPGIDLKWFYKEDAMKYEYRVRAGADHKLIRVQFKGAEKISINQKNQLEITTTIGKMIEEAPLVFQAGNQLPARWKINADGTVGYEIFNFDPAQDLIIDPLVKLWGTYLGGSGYDYTYFPHTDQNGNILTIGQTNSTNNIASSGGFQNTYGGNYDAFIIKMDPSGVRLWCTYYGGSNSDFANYIVSDPAGNYYFTGATSSTNTAVLVTPGCHQSIPSASAAANLPADGLLVKLNSSGVRIWGTFYGGNGTDIGYACDVDKFGNVFFCGMSTSTDGTTIATSGAHQTVNGGTNGDSFLAKFDTSGVRQWGTYFGGQNFNSAFWGEYATDCKTDPYGNIYMVGVTDCGTGNVIASSAAHQTVFGGTVDGYIVKFNTSGTKIWGTYYGGINSDIINSIAVDSTDLIIGGRTVIGSGTAIATPGSHQPAIGSNVGSSRVDLQACKLEYSIVSPK